MGIFTRTGGTIGFFSKCLGRHAFFVGVGVDAFMNRSCYGFHIRVLAGCCCKHSRGEYASRHGLESGQTADVLRNLTDG